MNDWKNKIYYSQCWEDPEVLLLGLDVGSADDVLSVTSGGCNTLALLLRDPKHITALDINPVQNYILELKMASIQSLEYRDFIGFLGVTHIHTDERMRIFKKIRQGLSPEASNWWGLHQSLIEKGIIHAGKFEKYLSIFRGSILPFIHSRKTVDNLSSLQSLSDQKRFYDEVWNTWRWRIVFNIFFSGFFMGLLGRNPKLFTYAGVRNIGSHYFKKTEYALTQIPIRNNFFMEYILYGTYRSQELMPPYLQEKNFNFLKERIGRIAIVTAGIGEFLSGRLENTFSRYNLSNVFEGQSVSDTHAVFGQLVRTGKNGARLVYWNNLVERKFPSSLATSVCDEAVLENKLKSMDRVFFYNNVHANSIVKKPS